MTARYVPVQIVLEPRESINSESTPTLTVRSGYENWVWTDCRYGYPEGRSTRSQELDGR